MAVFTLNAGTPLVHTTSSKEFELEPSKAIWLSAVGAQGLGVQNFGGGKKIYFRPSRDLDLFQFHESGPELQADKKGLIDLVKEGIGSGTLPASAIADAEEALKNALNADGTKWNSNRYVDRDLVDAISPSFDLLELDGWVRDFGNNREFLILHPGRNLVQEAKKVKDAPAALAGPAAAGAAPAELAAAGPAAAGAAAGAPPEVAKRDREGNVKKGEGKPGADPRIFSEREALAALMRTRKIYGKYFGPGGTVRKSDDNPLLNGPRGPLSAASVKRIKYILQQAIARRYRTYKAIKADHHIEIKPPNPDQKNRPRAELEARKELAEARMEAPPVSHHKMEGGRRAFSQQSSYVRKLIAAGEARGPTNYRKYMARGSSSDTESDESDEGSQFRRSMRAFKRARVQR